MTTVCACDSQPIVLEGMRAVLEGNEDVRFIGGAQTLLNGLALQRVSSSYDAREWVYLVHFNACFEAGSGKAPRCFACRSSLTAAFRPAPSIPLCFVRWRTPCIRERARHPGSIIRQ